MTLTGTAFFLLLILVAVLAMAGALIAWGRVRGPRALRWLTRIAMIVLCQVTAIALVAVWINNSFALYSSWDDLLGRDAAPAPAVAIGVPARTAMFSRYGNGMLTATLHGRLSGLSGQVLVWTPPEYNEPAYRDQRFPVIMLLHGVPGSPRSWIAGGGMPDPIAKMMEAGMMEPAIVAIPVIDPGGVDTDCSNTPTRKNATWLARDVPDLLRSQFRVLPEAKAWGLVGFSTGGLCSVKLAMQYPGTFSAAVGMDPDPLDGDPTVLKNAKLRKENSPIWLASKKPDVSIFLATSAQDRFSRVANITAFRKVVQWPTTVAEPLVLPTGGHNWQTFQRMFPTVFPWLSSHLDSAHVVVPAKPHDTQSGAKKPGDSKLPSGRSSPTPVEPPPALATR